MVSGMTKVTPIRDAKSIQRKEIVDRMIEKYEHKVLFYTKRLEEYKKEREQWGK